MANENIYSSNTTSNPNNIRKIIFNAGVESSLEYSNPVKNRVPRIQLVFSPFGLPFVPIEIIGSNVGDIVKSLDWRKDRNNAGGMLSFTLTPSTAVIQQIVDILNKYSGNYYSKLWGALGVDLEDLFKPMTLCQLWMDGYHVMTGYVRSCSRSSSVSNNSHEVSYSITVDELGAIYDTNIVSLDTILFDGLQTNFADALKQALELASLIKAVPVDAGISALVKAFTASTLATGFTLSDGFPLILRLLNMNAPFGAMSNLSYAQNLTIDNLMFELSGGQSFWEYIKNLIPNPWMEFYTESGGRTITVDNAIPGVMMPGFSYIVSRSVPYSNPLLGFVNPFHWVVTQPFDLNAIKMLIGGDFIIITDDDIQSKDIGFDSSNQFTMFHTRYGAGAGTNAPDNYDKPIKSAGPLNPLASGGVGTFGSRDLFHSINTTHFSNSPTSMTFLERTFKNIGCFTGQMLSKPALSNLLAVWFRNQSRFREAKLLW